MARRTSQPRQTQRAIRASAAPRSNVREPSRKNVVQEQGPASFLKRAEQSARAKNPRVFAELPTLQELVEKARAQGLPQNKLARQATIQLRNLQREQAAGQRESIQREYNRLLPQLESESRTQTIAENKQEQQRYIAEREQAGEEEAKSQAMERILSNEQKRLLARMNEQERRQNSLRSPEIQRMFGEVDSYRKQRAEATDEERAKMDQNLMDAAKQSAETYSAPRKSAIEEKRGLDVEALRGTYGRAIEEAGVTARRGEEDIGLETERDIRRSALSDVERGISESGVGAGRAEEDFESASLRRSRFEEDLARAQKNAADILHLGERGVLLGEKNSLLELEDKTAQRQLSMEEHLRELRTESIANLPSQAEEIQYPEKSPETATEPVPATPSPSRSFASVPPPTPQTGRIAAIRAARLARGPVRSPVPATIARRASSAPQLTSYRRRNLSR